MTRHTRRLIRQSVERDIEEAEAYAAQIVVMAMRQFEPAPLLMALPWSYGSPVLPEEVM